MDAIRLHNRKLPPPPKGLHAKAAAFWRVVVQDYELEAFHLEILKQACKALQRCEEASAIVDKEGQAYIDPKSGRWFPHPSVGVEERARAAFLRGVRELGLDL